MKKIQLPIMIFLLLSVNMAIGSENQTLSSTKKSKNLPSFFNACIVAPLVMGVTTYSHTKLNESIANKNTKNHQYNFHSKGISLLTMGVVFTYNFYHWLDLYTKKDLKNNIASVSKTVDQKINDLDTLQKNFCNKRSSVLSSGLTNINTVFQTYLSEIEERGEGMNIQVDNCIIRGNEQTNQLDIVSDVIKNNRGKINNIDQRVVNCQNLMESIELTTQNNSVTTQKMINTVGNIDEVLSGMQDSITRALQQSDDILNKKNSK